MNRKRPPEFLYVKSGDYVVIEDQKTFMDQRRGKIYWIGQVINCVGGARKSNSWTLFQVINIDNGEICIVNADAVESIMKDQ